MLRRLIFVLCLIPGIAAAQLLTSFAPENDEKRPLLNSSKSSNGMTEEIFNEILDRVEEVYNPLVAAQNAQFELERDWEDETVNAYAQQIRNRWIIKMFGGLARHEKITPDGFALVACHEMGHHLGGAPTYGFFNSWASNEGQSDYYTTLKCSRKIWENDDNVAIMEERAAQGLVSNFVVNACNEAYQDANESALCVRASMGGYALADVLSALGGTGEISFETPDPNVVRRTQNRHPAAQCRLDTYFQAAICPVDHNIDPSRRNESTGMCMRAQGFEVGSRPLCWYKPSRSLSVLAGI